VVDGAVVGDRAQVGHGNELAAGARVWVDAVIPSHAIRFSSDEPQA
jgi:mannose-1-phosphate guanylyltransferase